MGFRPASCRMKPRILLAETTTPDGGRLALYAHDGHYKILLNNRELMHSYSTSSEVEMATHTASHFTEVAKPRYLIGGLGLGFTLRALLQSLPPAGQVEVVELLPEVVAWNREFLRDLNGALLDDPRVGVYEGDVVQHLRNSEQARYDAVLLDIDNGPTAMVQADNQSLYTARGLAHLRTLLRPGGLVAFWSAAADVDFERRLRQCGFAVEAVPTKAYPAARRAAYMIYYARSKPS